ncbi:MAG: aldehyde ferredoxin oxidoreductase C-terminal domain-containing protein, partial [Desulfobacterales bacterium]|nr:aldehyde ferredoxin oxidoreductase C-terminal domain-containing protein [Desulfobacterales bacterium]
LAYELGGEWEDTKLDPLSTEHKAKLVASLQNHSAGTDTLVKCDFGSFGISTETYAEMLSAAVGREITARDILDTGERIWSLTRMFNIAQGLDTSQDTLPKRFINEPLPDGPAKGHRITEEDMTTMLQDYYQVRGWDTNGVPTSATLARLNLTHSE